jgi:hypothetical protein
MRRSPHAIEFRECLLTRTIQCSAWTNQSMQAIILCEFFARFRGRKVVTRPSKMFESLYSRVSSQKSLPSS